MPKFFTNAARRVLYIYNNGGFASPGVDEPTVSYPSLFVTNANGIEGSTINVRVTSSFAVNQNITFTYATANGTAAAGTHYTSTSGTGVILANTTFVDIPISTVDLDGAQGNKTLTLTISNALQGAQSLTILNAVASVLIIDSDVSAGNEYYNYITSLPTVFGTEGAGYWSLRNNDSINSILGTDGQARKTWEYVYGADSYDNPQDGAKVVMAHSLSTSSQLRAQFGPQNFTDGKLLFMNDFWFGPEFLASVDTAFDDAYSQKFYNVQDGGDNGSGASIYIEPRIRGDNQAQFTFPEFAKRDLRTYGQGSNVNNQGPMAEWGIVRNTGYEPSGEGAVTAGTLRESSGRWVRHWFEVQLDRPGTDFADFVTSTGTATSPYPFGSRTVVGATYGAVNKFVTLEIEKLNTGDSFTLTVNGQTTDPILFGAAGAAEIKAAIEALAGVAADDITVRQHPGSWDFRFDIEFGGTLAGTNPTISITATGFAEAAVRDRVTAGNKVTVTTDAWTEWRESSRPPIDTKITITGHSESALNGTWNAFVVDNTTLILNNGPVISGGGTGGNACRHFHMFSWWQADEDRAMQRVYYQVPVQKRNIGQIIEFRLELNSSSKPKAIKGWDMLVAPSVGSPTTITTPTNHTLTTGDTVLIVQNSEIPYTHYQVTVTGPDTFTIPVSVTQASTLNTSGQYANTYGRVFTPLIGYTRSLVTLRNHDVNEADTDFFAQPLP